MVEFQVARDQNLMCVTKRTYGEIFMLVSSTEVFPQNPISLIIFILDLGPSYTDKLLEFRWVQIAHLS